MAQLVFHRPTFFTYVRRAPFGNRLSQSQVDGLERIVGHFESAFPKHDIRHLAYILATVFHETGGRMEPVREGFAKTDAAARKIIAKRKYGVPHPRTKQVYYGRGDVQLTWFENYGVMGNLLGIDLVNKPDLALDPKISVRILFEGMMNGKSTKGDFTGKSLEQYFNGTTDDPVGARRIINGVDKAKLIAGYHAQFLDALTAARDALRGHMQADVTVESAKPDTVSLLTDKTAIGALTTGLGGVAASLVGAISNPWALAAFAIVAIGVFLAVTGRIEIKRKAGA